ncbi:vWA domain-containing protein [Niveispirillum fermenti]|uniref:vWA domain-containing protein n=1 Tax=Niveispirillum fermenti TaxID=1233113 RepID=UPI003A856FE6
MALVREVRGVDDRRDRMLLLAACALLLVLAVTIGWLALRACGLSLPWPGGGLSFCPASAMVEGVGADDPQAAHLAAQMAELAALERQLALAPACPTPPEPTPEPPVEATPPAPPPPPVPQQRAAAAPPPPARPACAMPSSDRVVLVLDVSRSMEVSHRVDAAQERRMLQLDGIPPLLRALMGTEREYQALSAAIDATPGESRISVAQGALTELTRLAEPDVTFDLVSFATCGAPEHHGSFVTAERDRLRQSIAGVTLKPATALSGALEALPIIAPPLPGGGPINVVLVSDGYDTCGGDACATAHALAQRRPDLKVSVVAVSQQIDELRCIAGATGGHYVAPADLPRLAAAVRAAAGQARAEDCE